MKCPDCNFENPEDTLYCGKCGTKITPAVTETMQAPKEELTTGTTFARRYQIIEELGKGGMGKVYKVHDTEIKEKVALKLLKPEIAGDEKTIERFRNELKLARKIAHRNVCKTYDLGEEKGTRYITMEFVAGEDLKSTIRRIGQLPVGKSLSITKQICEGLAEAHRLGVVHRDLKPQNIMIDEEGNARIMDFGIARSIKAKGITGSGVMIGTPEYMSPEQVEGKEVDQRSDIYSLGVILYEMVTGRVPFEGDTPYTIGVKHKSETPKDPRELNAQIPEDLSHVILRCLEKEKANRYQSTGELRSELTAIESGMPTTERDVPKRKPMTSREITVQVSMKKLAIPALIIVALVIIAVAIWQLLPQKEALPVLTGKPSLAIMYFENNTGDENLDHYRKALSDLLITDLSQSKYINVLRGDRLFNILNQLNQLEAKSYSSDILKQVAARGRATHILQGNYTKAGENFRINIMLHDARTEELMGSEVVEGRGEESIFSMVDDLTRRIKANFKLTDQEIADDLDEEVGKITTSSLEAFKYYSQGRKFHHTGDFRQSIQTIEKALAIDPEFAMAYRSIGMSYNNLGYEAERKKHIKKAFELSDRASDRERYIIQGDYFREKEETYDKAIEAYNNLLALYPEDTIGNTNLGILYNALEQWDRAIERFEVLMQTKDESPYHYGNLASSYAAMGLYDKGREILEDFLNNVSDNPIVRAFLVYNIFCQGKYDLALIQADKFISLYPTFYFAINAQGDIFRYKGNLGKADEEYNKLLEHKEQTAHMFGRDNLSALYLLQGKFKESENQSKRGMELAIKLGDKEYEQSYHWSLAYLNLRSDKHEQALEDIENMWNIALQEDSLEWQRRALFLKGLIYIKMKKLEEAQKAAEELEEIIDRGMNRKLMRYFYHLMGSIELEKGAFSEAIEYLDQAISLLHYQFFFTDDHALFLDSLALAYNRAGNLEKAREEYEKITTLSSGCYYYGDIHAKSFYMLGKIHEQQGNKSKAVENYEKFLGLWKDADPGFPEVEDAKKRLAALQSQ